MRTIYIYFITLLISANVFAQNNSDLINVPFKLDPQPQKSTILTNQTPFGFTICSSGSVTIPINITINKIPSVAILFDIKPTNTNNYMYGVTYYMKGVDEKEYWSTLYIAVSNGQLRTRIE